MNAHTERVQKLLDRYPSSAKITSRYIPKSDGTRRLVIEPDKELSVWLKQVNRVLRTCFNNWPPYMHGGIKKRSYVSHAKPHVGQQCLVTVDVRRCFDSIDDTRIVESLERILKLPRNLCTVLATKLTFKGRLAQGFATSNYISNLVLMHPLSDIDKFVRAKSCVLTNYVDDIAISGKLQNPAEIINFVAETLSRAGLAIKKSKVSVMPSNKQQIVCGLVVNRKLALSTESRKSLYGRIAEGSISPVALAGSIANIRSFDSKLADRFHQFGLLKGFDLVPLITEDSD